MRILAIDFGRVRTGVAICDVSETIASPLCVVPSVQREVLYNELCVIVRRQQPGLIVVGRPLRTDGVKSEMALAAEAFAKKLQEMTGVEVQLYDERFTTVIAAQRLHANEKSAKKQKKIIDAAAAAVLLQNFIDGRKK